MNELLWFVMDSGFPILLVILYAFALVSVWRNRPVQERKKWLAIILGPPVLTILIFAILSVNPLAPFWRFLLFLSGLGGGFVYWLFATR